MRLLSRKQVLDKIAVSRTTLDRWLKAETFPEQTYIGDGNRSWQKAFWDEEEVDDWIRFHLADKSTLADYHAPKKDGKTKGELKLLTFDKS